MSECEGCPVAGGEIKGLRRGVRVGQFLDDDVTSLDGVGDGAAQKRFGTMPPTSSLTIDTDRVEFWDADDFDPWDNLQWETVRVMRYRQHKADGKVYEAYWLKDFPTRKLTTQPLYRLAKSRWEVENHGFNDGKNRYGMSHVQHHHENSLVVCWLIMLLAMVIERLYRQRYLHRGKHLTHGPIQFLRLLRQDLFLATPPDTS